MFRFSRVVCHNFEHPNLTSSFTKYKILKMKNSFANIVDGLSVLKLFQLSNGDFRCLYTASKNLGQGVEVRTHYPSGYM